MLFMYLALFFCLGAVISGHVLTYWPMGLLMQPKERGLIRDGFPDGGTLDQSQNHVFKCTWI